MSCYVDRLADEVEPGHAPALHGLGGEFGGGDAACGDLGLGVPFGARGCDLPAMQTDLRPRGVTRCSIRKASGVRPSVCKALRQNGAQRGPEGSGIAAAGVCAQRSGAVLFRRKVDGDGAARLSNTRRSGGWQVR